MKVNKRINWILIISPRLKKTKVKKDIFIPNKIQRTEKFKNVQKRFPIISNSVHNRKKKNALLSNCQKWQ